MNLTNSDYYELIGYMKELRLFFHKTYGAHFKLGQVYQGNPEFSYFSLTSDKLKQNKLKFVIVLNHKMKEFKVCLSGQNKDVRKKYWTFFNDNNYCNYHLSEAINTSLSIVDHTIIEVSDFSNKVHLAELIRKESVKFMEEIKMLIR